MTGREIKLWIGIGAVVAAGLVYNLVAPFFTDMETQKVSSGSWNEAARLFRSEGNIRARNRAARERYRQLLEKFYPAPKKAAFELEVLEVIEDIDANCGLPIRLKNTLQLAPDEIGVALEGTTGSEMLYRFLQQLTEAAVGMQVKTLQLHATPEKREFDYQLVVSVLVVK
jgi:hypothetical protein